ncbi:hypothetical protein ADK67_04765 [Saccharothrix sp. NRRL B-16348]|uniref:hypothetical protein n=1 Tax=Saccharothrix sp. NRRL B-16348 TaxID=1415542 RepID=UPI0006ADE033|nr:hypothetical protein [Saccharothrix sp. NRRL B-16348]KOX33965.1 hypothetical protein ADK67_04765 [Saccharothrix sp. NRRL B-16348]
MTRDEQRSALVGLVIRATENWARTWRLVVLLVVPAVLLGGLLWFVPFDLVFGPFSLIPK